MGCVATSLRRRLCIVFSKMYCSVLRELDPHHQKWSQGLEEEIVLTIAVCPQTSQPLPGNVFRNDCRTVSVVR